MDWAHGIRPMVWITEKIAFIVEVPNFWKHMKYPHMFTNHNNLNQQSH
jgi:hypothetical protein